MPQLPGTLGPLNVPQSRQRIAQVDTASAVGIRANGQQALLQGAANGLQTIQTANTTSQLADAQSQFLQTKVTQDNAYHDDNNWQTIPQRYTDNLTQVRDQSAQMITDPAVRNQFIRDSNLQMQRGTIDIQQLAKGKESDQGRANLVVGLNNNLQAAAASSDTATRAGLLQSMTQQVDAAAGKGYLDQEGAARLKVDYGNKYIAQRQSQLTTELGGKLDTIIGNAYANPDMNANVAAIDQAAAGYAGSVPADDLAKMVVKAKNDAFKNSLLSDNLSVSKGFQVLNGKQPLDAVDRQFTPSPELMDGIVSNGEFGKTGQRNQTSGALGKYQIMPATGRAMAAQLGMPYDETKLQYDDEYGKTLATGLMQQLLTRYNGDVTMATAAYNANPDAVDNWARQFGDPSKGQISDSEWAAAIPYDETRGYVGRVVPALAQKTGGFSHPAQTPITNPILQSAVAKFPRLAKYAANTVLVEKANPTGDDRMLESMPPWESNNPNPGKQTTELYTQGTTDEKGNLVAGDLLHYIGGTDPSTGKAVDPRYHQFKDQLIASLTPQQMANEKAYYEESKKYYDGQPPTFDVWMEHSRADELMMGYLTPDKVNGDDWSKYYTPQQKDILQKAKDYLSQPDQKQDTGDQQFEAQIQRNFTANKDYVKPGVTNFRTVLPPDQEATFRDWIKKNKIEFNPDRTGPDTYDMRGFYKAMLAGDPQAQPSNDPKEPGLHFTDKFKTPYHGRFSDQSIYATSAAPAWNDKDQLVTKNGVVLYDNNNPATHDYQGPPAPPAQPAESSPDITKLGGDPAAMPQYQAIIDAKRQRQATQDQAQWTAQNQKLVDGWDDNIASWVATGKGTLNLPDFANSLAPEKMRSLQGQIDQAQKLNSAVQPIVSGTTSDAKKAIDGLEPLAGDIDFAAKQKAYETAQKLLSARIEGLQKDPAAYVQQNDAVAQDAAAELDQLDIRDPEQSTQAQVDADTIRSAQRRMGVSDQDIKPLTNAKAADLGNQVMTADPAHVTDLLDTVSKVYGQDGARQVLAAKGVSPTMRYVAFMDNPADAVLRNRTVMAAQTPHDDLVHGMTSKNITEAQVRSQIQSILPQALTERPGWGDYETGMVNTAMSLINSGMTLSAASAAVYAPWNRAYHYTSSLNVPTKYDFAKIQQGLDGAVANLSKFDIEPKGGSPLGLRRDWTTEQSRAALQRAHIWTNLPDDSGAVLSYDPGDGLPGDPVMLSSGQRLVVKFSDAESGTFGRRYKATYGRAGGPQLPAGYNPTPPVPPSAPAAPSVPAQPTAPQQPVAPAQPDIPVPPTRPRAPISPTAPSIPSAD